MPSARDETPLHERGRYIRALLQHRAELDLGEVPVDHSPLDVER